MLPSQWSVWRNPAFKVRISGLIWISARIWIEKSNAGSCGYGIFYDIQSDKWIMPRKMMQIAPDGCQKLVGRSLCCSLVPGRRWFLSEIYFHQFKYWRTTGCFNFCSQKCLIPNICRAVSFITGCIQLSLLLLLKLLGVFLILWGALLSFSLCPAAPLATP